LAAFFILRVMKIFLMLAMILSFSQVNAQMDTLHVRFLYGSKPKPEFRKKQKPWFGGMLGGHVGLRYNDTSFLSFFYEGKVHIFQNKKRPNGKYAFQSDREFNKIMDENVDSVKTLVIKIPITKKQRAKYDSICERFVQETPYDYAFFGFRCGSSTYHVLSEIDVLEKESKSRIWRKVFYPKILRRRLIREARQKGWRQIRHEGTRERIWERD
jgi:hypothetical protein